ncbi:MAG: hypothetical protein QM652_00065 [Legionella sp.]|uniref:hypothetical protein n=1 Tax=Legionella sp. TaxID=459 RepID=UPI0039E52988
MKNRFDYETHYNNRLSLQSIKQYLSHENDEIYFFDLRYVLECTHLHEQAEKDKKMNEILLKQMEHDPQNYQLHIIQSGESAAAVINF